MKNSSNINQWILAIIIAVTIGALRVWLAYQIEPYLGNGAGDFSFATRLSRDIWAGRDPYDYKIYPDSTSYPLTTGVVAMPFALFKDETASGLFMGLSALILAWCLLSNKGIWALLVFLSWPFAYSLIFAQWTPLIMAIWFLPVLSPLILIKPQMAFPLIVTGKISKTGVAIAVILLLISLIILPKWPIVWLGQTRGYKGLPPLLSLPLGPLLLLALIKYRDRRAWLLVLLALMPQRVLYDQLPLLLIATTGIEMAFLVFCSWLTLPLLFTYGGWGGVPVNWQFWIILTLYLPALFVLLGPDLVRLARNTFSQRFAKRTTPVS